MFRLTEYYNDCRLSLDDAGDDRAPVNAGEDMKGNHFSEKSHEYNELWKGLDGWWKLQADRGILSFKTKRDALKMQAASARPNN